MKWSGMILALALLLTPILAQANPIAMEVLRGRQIPGTHHVQLTYAVDGSTPKTPISSTKDDADLSLTWKQTSTSFSANTGSGLRSLSATQACDCNVAVGKREYVVKIQSATGSKTIDLPVTVNVVQTLAAPADAGAPAGDVMPWNIPEPGQVQGLDCVAVCGGASSDGSVTTKDAGVKTPELDERGCAMTGGDTSSLAWVLLLLGIGLFLRRR